MNIYLPLYIYVSLNFPASRTTAHRKRQLITYSQHIESNIYNMSSTQDPHTGGTLSEMANGTTMPNDAGLQRVLPSVPRPDQRSEDPQFDNEGVAEPTPQFAADNPVDLPRSTRDMGMTGEVMSGTADSLGAKMEAQRAEIGANGASTKGNVRKFKHAKKNRSAFERGAKEDDDAADYIGEDEARMA